MLLVFIIAGIGISEFASEVIKVIGLSSIIILSVVLIVFYVKDLLFKVKGKILEEIKRFDNTTIRQESELISLKSLLEERSLDLEERIKNNEYLIEKFKVDFETESYAVKEELKADIVTLENNVACFSNDIKTN